MEVLDSWLNESHAGKGDKNKSKKLGHVTLWSVRAPRLNKNFLMIVLNEKMKSRMEMAVVSEKGFTIEDARIGRFAYF